MTRQWSVCVCVAQGDGGGGESCVSETGMLRQFAFVTCLLRVLSRGLQSFKLARYRQLNKRIGRLIRSVRLGHHSALWLRHLLYYYFPSTAVAVEITAAETRVAAAARPAPAVYWWIIGRETFHVSPRCPNGQFVYQMSASGWLGSRVISKSSTCFGFGKGGCHVLRTDSVLVHLCFSGIIWCT